MGHPVSDIYRRGAGLALALPWLLALPAAAEFAQHAAEILIGMYAPGGIRPGGAPIRLAFGAAKIGSILLLLIIALRWWRFDGDLRRALMPNGAMLRGLGIVIAVQIGGEALVLLIGGRLAAMAEPGARPIAIAGPLLAWLFAAGLLFPWYVGLIVEDRSMTLLRSVRATRARLPGIFGCLLAGVLPLMVTHYAIGYGAMLRPALVVWGLMVVDAVVVALLAAMIAASYFTIYSRAADRLPS